MAIYKKSGAVRPARPKLRCPACGAEMTPPVEFCPECGADPRLAFLKKKRPRRLWPRILFGAQFCLLAAAFGLLYKHAPWRGDGLPPAPVSAPAGLSPEARREAIAAAPAEFQRLAEENPLLLLPYIYVYRAKTSLERHQDQFQAQFGQIGELDLSRDIVAFQKATPGQRQKMLEELFMIRPEDGSP
ncbi:MAG: zinc ribbon domain-containing protein [Candidatus Adiutrix sp.]|jgi:hypothetical protein|nr:zinc ribbon domain-containing protein [Candidatus Adiutrix sp.]